MPTTPGFAIAALVLVALPLLVIPSFLDYAQEAKTVGLLLLIAGLALAAAADRLPLRPQAMLSGPMATPSLRVVLALILLIALDCFGTTWAPGQRVAWHAVRNELVAMLAAAMIAVVTSPRAIAPMLFIGASTTAALGLLQVGLDITYLTPSSDPGQFPGVTFGNRGLAGLYVTLGLAPGFWLLGCTTKRRRAGVVLGLSCCITFIFVSLTRAVWLAALASSTLWLFMSWQRRRWAWRLSPFPQVPPSPRLLLKRLAAVFGLILALAVGVLLVAKHPALRLLVAQRLDPVSWTANPRFSVWAATLAHFQRGGVKEWLLGFGPGAFQTLSFDWLSASAWNGRMLLDAHNDTLQYLVDHGLIGLVLRIGLVLAGIRRLFRWSRREPNGLPDVFLCGVTAILVAAQLFYPLRLPYFIMLFTLCLLMSEHPPRVPVWSVTNTRRHTHQRWIALATAALCLTLAWQRIILETTMRAYVKEPASFPERLARRDDVLDHLRWASCPEGYLRMVGKKP